MKRKWGELKSSKLIVCEETKWDVNESGQWDKWEEKMRRKWEESQFHAIFAETERMSDLMENCTVTNGKWSYT